MAIGDPELLDYLKNSGVNTKLGNVTDTTRSDFGLENIAQLFTNRFPQAAGPSFGQGFANIFDILQSNGQIPVQGRNLQLADIARQTEAEKRAAGASAAVRGVQNSGVAEALQAAIGQAGADRRAGALAQFDNEAEARRRQDLGLFIAAILQPALQAALARQGVFANQDITQRQLDAQGGGEWLAGIGSILGGLSGFNFGGGKGKE